jgi:hypothetical protein
MVNVFNGLESNRLESLSSLGAGSRRFKSSRPDHNYSVISTAYNFPKLSQSPPPQPEGCLLAHDTTI